MVWDVFSEKVLVLLFEILVCWRWGSSVLVEESTPFAMKFIQLRFDGCSRAVGCGHHDSWWWCVGFDVLVPAALGLVGLYFGFPFLDGMCCLLVVLLLDLVGDVVREDR